MAALWQHEAGPLDPETWLRTTKETVTNLKKNDDGENSYTLEKAKLSWQLDCTLAERWKSGGGVADQDRYTKRQLQGYACHIIQDNCVL